MNTNTRYAQTLNAAVGANKVAFVEVGYGQVEPNHLSAQRTGQIYAQLPAEPNISVLQQGQFVKYNYANGLVTFGDYENADGETFATGEWMLVYNEIKLYREGQNDCEFAMLKTDYNARIYSPYGEDKTEGRRLQSRYYNGVDTEGNSGYTFYTLTKDTTFDSGKTYYTKDPGTGAYAEATGLTEFEEDKEYYEKGETYKFDKVTTDTQDIYEMFQTNDPFKILPGYKEAKMPEGTKMVPRVFKTNIGDIYTTNTIDWDEEDGANPIEVGVTLKVAKATGLLTKAEGAAAGTFENNDPMVWQVVKVYTMPDGQKGVKLMRIA